MLAIASMIETIKINRSLPSVKLRQRSLYRLSSSWINIDTLRYLLRTSSPQMHEAATAADCPWKCAASSQVQITQRRSRPPYHPPLPHSRTTHPNVIIVANCWRLACVPYADRFFVDWFASVSRYKHSFLKNYIYFFFHFYFFSGGDKISLYENWWGRVPGVIDAYGKAI